MKYDDASWHYSRKFPPGLPNDAAATHIAMFVAWAVLNGLAGRYHTTDAADDLARLRNRVLTPGKWFIAACDEKFTTEDLSAEGNSFAHSYYANEETLHTSGGSYVSDYCETFPSVRSLYEVEDSWTSFDELAPKLTRRFQEWLITQH